MELRARLLTRVDLTRDAEFRVLADTENIGHGGVCVVSDSSIPSNSVLRCEMVVPGSSVGVPTLMQVRWTEKNGDAHKFRIGLQFLL
jgi:PilZ domain